MTTLKRTTLTIPEDILKRAKLLSIQENKPLSALVRELLSLRLNGTKPKRSANPASVLGKLAIGTKKLYKKRSEIYG